MSCGTPKCASTRLPSAVSATACASVMQASGPSAPGLLRPELDPLGAPAGQRAHRDRLVPEPQVDDPAVLDREVVRVDHPRHDGLAQPRAGVEHRAGAPPAHRVRGEQHARRPARRPSAGPPPRAAPRRRRSRCRRGRRRRGPSTARPSSGAPRRAARRPPRRSGRCPAGRRSWPWAGPRRWPTTGPPPARPAPRRRPARRPDPPGAVVLGAQAAVGRDDGRRDVVRQRCGAQQLARSHGIGGVDAGRSPGVRRRGHAEPAGHRQSRGDQLAEVRRLATHRRQVRSPQLPEVQHQRRTDGGRRGGTLGGGHTSR